MVWGSGDESAVLAMRRLLILVCLGLAVLTGADFVWWRSAERQLEKGLAAQVQSVRNAGGAVSASVAVRGGWPVAASLTVGDLFVTSGQIAWSTDRLVLEQSVFHPFLLVIESMGMQRLRVGASPDTPYTADTLRATVPLQAGVPPRGFRLQVINFRAGLGEMAAEGLTVGTLNLQTHWTPAAQQNEAAVSASISLSGIRLPTGPSWPFGSAIETVSADLALNGPLPRAKEFGLKDLPEGVASRATSWRDAGGTLEVQHLSIDWGALDLIGSATLALDDLAQPMGAGSVRIRNSLREYGLLGERAEFAAKALLALLQKPGGEDEKPEVELPVTLQDRRLSISRYGVMRFPKLSLPQ